MINLIKDQFYAPILNYMFWSVEKQDMFPVNTILYENGLAHQVYLDTLDTDNNPTMMAHAVGPNDVLIPSTGLYTKTRDELYYGDLVLCTAYEHPREAMVFWDNGWRIFGLSTAEFQANVEDRIFKIGNKWQNPVVYTKYLESINREPSAYYPKFSNEPKNNRP